MPATAIARSLSGSVDRSLDRIMSFIGNFGNGSTCDPYWVTSLVEDGIGSRPGRIEIVMGNQFNTVDAAATLAWNPDKLSGQLKHGMDITSFHNFQTQDADGNKKDGTELIFCGKIDGVREIRSAAGNVDQIIVNGSDARTELGKIRFDGRVIYNAARGTFHYQSGWRCHFNPGGRPNCIKGPDGQPWFAPYPDYGAGYSTNENPPPDSKVTTVIGAFYWTLGDIVTYAYNVYGPKAFAATGATLPASVITDFTFFPFVSRCPRWILWPATFGTALDYEATANFDAGVGQNNAATGSARKGPDLDATGLYLIGSEGKPGLLDILFNKAGGLSYSIKYSVDADASITGVKFGVVNTLVVVPSRFTSVGTAVNMPFAAGGSAATTLAKPACTGGVVSMDSRETMTRTVAKGALIKIETRLTTQSNGGLVYAWQDARLTAFLTRWIALGGTVAAFQEAIGQYPEVLSQFMLDPTYDFTTGTQMASRPRSKIPRPIWPFLLSFQGQDYGPRDSISQPLPIRAEVYVNGAWQLAHEFGINSVWDSGVINCDTLRNLPLSGDPNYPGTWSLAAGKTFPISAPTDIVLNDIRMTIAIPTDERLLYALRISSDYLADGALAAPAGNGVQFFDVNGECPDVDRFDPTFTRTAVLDLHSLYELWIQAGSWPIPETSGAGAVVNNPALRDDTALLQSHARRDLREKFRLDRSASSLDFDGWLITAYPPGTMVAKLKPIGLTSQTDYVVNSVIARRRFEQRLSKDEQGVDSYRTKTSHSLK